MLKVDPKRKCFQSAESIDFNGNTGPFIQYTYARIQSLLNRANFVKKILEIINQMLQKKINYAIV